MPTISVLLPTYKPNKEFLRHAMQSLLSQTYTDWELIICNEPTETNTKEFLSPFLLEDDRIQYYENPTQLGIGGNWNQCLEKASGTYVQYLFQDDWWEPAYLETCIKRFEQHKEIGFVCTMHHNKFEDSFGQKHYYDDVQKLRQQHAGKRHNGLEFLQMWLKRGLHPNLIGEPPFVCMRKKVMDQVGKFSEVLPQFLDSEYWIRLLQRTDFYYEQTPLGTFRVHEAGASAQHQLANKGLTDRLFMLSALTKSTQRSIRSNAKKSLKTHFPRMIQKYFARKTMGSSAFKGDSMLKKFALNHPWLTISSFIKVAIYYDHYDALNKQLSHQ